MPRKKPAEAELILPTNRTKVVNAKHKIEYDAPVVVPDDVLNEDDTIIEDDPPEEIERKRKRKNARDEREDIRREMESLGVVAAGDLKLMIEKYKHSDSAESGTLADRIYCTKYTCTREHIMNQDYLEVAGKWGPGRYWFTLRHKNKIVKPWEREITAPGSGQIIQHINPNDPTSPQVIVQMPENGQAVPFDPVRQMKEQSQAFKQQLENYKLMRDVFGPVVENGQSAVRGEDEVLAGAILKQPEVIENVVGSVIKRFGGKGEGAEDPSPWAVAMKLVETGQAAQIVKTLVDSVFNGIGGMIPGRQNGQAQMAQTPPQMDNGQMRLSTGNGMVQGQASSDAHQQGIGNAPSTEIRQDDAQQMTPADQALTTVVNDCARRIPPQVTFTNLMTFADAVNDQMPAHSIDGWITYFASMPIDGAIEFVKSLPNGEQITSLPHAKAWTEKLQQLIRENEGEE